MPKKKKKTNYNNPQKMSFPEDSIKQPWLPPLLEAYGIVDKGISEAIRKELRTRRTLACRKGCSNCCKTHGDIPVYPLELVGISWFVVEKMSNPERHTVQKQLEAYRKNDPCPFLFGTSCAVHPMRPVACRQFIVFGKPCDVGEDPYYTRRHDVLTPIQRYVDRAFFVMLPFYGITKDEDRWRIIGTGMVHSIVRRIQSCNWKSLAGKMASFSQASG